MSAPSSDKARRLIRGAAWATALVSIESMLTLLGFKRTRRWLARLARVASRPENARRLDAEGFRGVSAEVVAVSHHRVIASLGVDCVAESLLLLLLAETSGLPARLRIGVASRDPFGAHAWVEDDLGPVNDEPDVEARVLPFPDPVDIPSPPLK